MDSLKFRDWYLSTYGRSPTLQRKREMEQQEEQPSPSTPPPQQQQETVFQGAVSRNLAMEPEETSPLVSSKESGVSRKKTPSYESLHEKMNIKTVRCKLAKVCKVLGLTGLYILIFVVVIGVPVSMTIIGATHLDDCIARKYLPIYLLVLGVVLLLRNILYYWNKAVERGCSSCCLDGARSRNQEHQLKRLVHVLDGVVILLLIVESVHVFSLFNEVEYEDSTATAYCPALLYRFSLWSLAGLYLAVAVIFIVIIVRSCCCPLSLLKDDGDHRITV